MDGETLDLIWGDAKFWILNVGLFDSQQFCILMDLKEKLSLIAMIELSKLTHKRSN